MKTAAVIVAALAVITWRFMRAWRSAWAADAADYARFQCRHYDSEINDD